MFYPVMVSAHSGWRYVVAVLVLFAFIKYLIGWIAKGHWSSLDARLLRFTPIAIDIQFLLGAIIWIMGSWWDNGSARIAWEHPAMGLLALALAHVTSVRVGSAADSAGKYRFATLAYLAIIVLIALGVSAVLGTFNIFARP